MLAPKTDRYIGRSLMVYGEFSELEVAALALLTKPGDLVIDAGANLGALTLPLARRVGATGGILAFEPQRLIFQMLCANLALNEITNVQAVNAALGQAKGVVAVAASNLAEAGNFGGLGVGGNLGLGGNHAGRAAITTIDSLNLTRLDLIKADVEGMEADVIEGARATIARLRPKLYLENDRAAKSAALIRLVQSLNYRLWWHLPPLFNPENFRNERENLFPGTVSVNMVCLPAERHPPVSGLIEIVDPDISWTQALDQIQDRAGTNSGNTSQAPENA